MELATRMQKTVLGQVTWADPDIGKKCWECAHSKRVYAKGHKTYICTLVRVMFGKTGVPYDGQRAIACSKFAVVDTTTSE